MEAVQVQSQDAAGMIYHRESLLAVMHPALRQLYQAQTVLHERFQLTDVLDMGGFATVFKCNDIKGEGQMAVKVVVDVASDEHGNLTETKKKGYMASMKQEHKIYKTIKGGSPCMPPGVPKVYCSGAKKVYDEVHPKKFYLISFMVMQLLGAPAGRLSLEVQAYKHNTPLFVNHGLLMLKSLQCLHERALVHRDVKPDNFCMPLGYDIHNPRPTDAVYCLDMGMCMEWQHKGFSWDQQTYAFWGTVDYSSVRTLDGYHPTPRDDLEGLACTLLEMATGDVPFDLLHKGEEDKPLQLDRLRQMAAQKDKQWAQLLVNPSTPTFIKRWMRHLRSLPAKHILTPADYEAFRSILIDMLPRRDTATSAWSSAASLKQQDSKKRAAPEPSRASNLHSCMSDTATAATVVQSKRFKHLQEEEEEEASMACGVFLHASPEE